MNEALFESFAAELTALVAQDAAGRCVSKLAAPMELAGAARAFANLKKVAVVSGFYIPWAGAPETDGPGGAAILARAFLREGCRCEIWTDALCLSVLKRSAAAAGCPEGIVRAAPHSLDDETPDGIIFVERLGRAADGRYYNFKKHDVTEWTAPLDAFPDEAARRRIRTIGIGDGGNEAGMGKFYNELVAMLPDYISCLSVVKTDFALAADVSNWGAYALASALSFLWGRWRGINAGEETKILEAAVSEGAVDGISGKSVASVDVFSAASLEDMAACLQSVWERRETTRARYNV